MPHITIGEASRRANVNAQTIRFYERRGLLPQPGRTASNYRCYTTDTIRRVRFIKRAQELGFTLSEIQELLSLRSANDRKAEEVRRQAQSKVCEIDAKISALEAIRQVLTELICECSADAPVDACPILTALDGGDLEG